MSSLAISPLPPHLNSASSSSSQPLTTPRASRNRPSPASSPQSYTQASPRAGSPRGGGNFLGDAEASIKANGGDVRRALDAVVSERNSLQAQNTQLWKLVEKQRAQTATLATDNERIRSDRERANARLAAAGLDPVGRKIANSTSAMGLGIRADPPPIRRNNSDREERVQSPRPTLQIPSGDTSNPYSPGSSVSAPSSVIPETSSVLLPSPMTDHKLRRESRMTFPPEVSSFMSLADSPRDARHTIPQIPPSTSYNTLSPSSQYSASPGGEVVHSPPSSVPPPSSRMLAITTEVEEEEELRREPSPPPRSTSIKSPAVQQHTHSPVQSTHSSFAIPSRREGSTSRPSTESGSPRQSYDNDTPRASVEPFPSTITPLPSRSLPHLSATLLPHTRLSIPTSTVFPNSHGRDVLCFIITIIIRPPNSSSITWNVAKLFSAFLDLDTRIKARSGKNRKEWKSMVQPLPEGRAWKDFAPSKIDTRKAALEGYLQSLLVAPISDKMDLCEFLCSDPVQAKIGGTRKEGYLTKKGKTLGGWKTRYFVLDGPLMEYFESRGGARLGSITITNAQIGRQNRPSDGDEKDFRHAFLIIEASRRGTAQRHVLCAESDVERDNWIEALVKQVEPESLPIPIPPPPPLISMPSTSSTHSAVSTNGAGLARRRSNSRKQSRDVVVVRAAQPMSNLASGDSKFAGAPSPSLFNSMENKRLQQASTSDSTPSLASSSTQPSVMDARLTTPANNNNPITVITSPSSEVLSTSPPTDQPFQPTPRAAKRQSMMPARSGSSGTQSHSAAYLTKVASDGISALPNHFEKDRERKAKSGRFWPSFNRPSAVPEKPTRPVFAVPLNESLAIASVANLPAIVFRCIEYMETKKAETEEGIYRLSGSSAVIKGLKDRFDMEGDVRLLEVDEFWDPHAIAGLLKTFLRDLPTSLLTRDLHPRFLAVMDLIDSSARVAELSRLISDLPPPNYALLRALTAHLILIVANSAINKMTLRNIGIVFSPTLGIPAGIFSELVSHFGAIFDDEPEEPLDGVGEDRSLLGLSGEDTEETIRRKRNSMLYQAGGADAMLGLAGRALDPSLEDSASEISVDDLDSEDHSTPSDEDHQYLAARNTTPRAEPSRLRKPTSSARAAERGLAGETSDNGTGHSGGMGWAEALGSPARSVNGGLPPSPRLGMGEKGISGQSMRS